MTPNCSILPNSLKAGNSVVIMLRFCKASLVLVGFHNCTVLGCWKLASTFSNSNVLLTSAGNIHLSSQKWFSTQYIVIIIETLNLLVSIWLMIHCHILSWYKKYITFNLCMVSNISWSFLQVIRCLLYGPQNEGSKR